MLLFDLDHRQIVGLFEPYLSLRQRVLTKVHILLSKSEYLDIF